MKKILFVLALIISGLPIMHAQTTAPQNISLQAQLQFDQDLSDVWGYVDDTAREFAIVGLNRAVAIVNVTTPDAPDLISIIDGPRSIWRDIKTYEDHAFVITDSEGLGLHVLDLSNLPNPLDSTDHYFWAPHLEDFDSIQLEVCHNLYIDEQTGIAYLAGCNVNSGGILMVDVTNPDSLVYIGALDARYSHDVYVRNDTVYSSDISAGFLSIMDATDKANPVLLATQTTPFRFTHNAWLSDNSKVVFTTDERGNAPVAAYDISDLSDIKLLDEFRPSATVGRGLIPHNVHVFDDFLVTSFYKEGVIITDAHKPDNLVEVGNYDTVEGDRVSGFGGTWGAYPFLPSGTVLASDVENGLFILKPTYVRASYLEGVVTNATSGMPLTSVDVIILSDDPNSDLTNATGVFKTGQATPGTFQVEFSKIGFESKVVEVTIATGEVTNIEVALNRLPIAIGPVVLSCDEHTVKFEPSITNFGAYDWTFEGGTPSASNSFEPVITYSEAGTYPVSLKVKESLTGEVVDSLNIEVNVFDKPRANFDFTLNGKTIQLTNLSMNADSYVWEIADTIITSTDASFTFDSVGTFIITLAAGSAVCPDGDTTQQEIMIVATSLEDAGILEQFQVSPNPFIATTIINYQLNSLQEKGSIAVFNLLGEEVERYTLDQSSGQISIGQHLGKGVYLVQLQLGNQQSRGIKIVKQ